MLIHDNNKVTFYYSVTEAHELLSKWMRDLPFVDEDNETEEEIDEEETSDCDVNVDEERHVKSSSWKPFGAYFQMKLQDSILDPTLSTASFNPLYKPSFIEKLHEIINY